MITETFAPTYTDHQVEATELLDDPIRVGDPFEADMAVERRDPDQVIDYNWISRASYLYPAGQYSFAADINGRSFGGVNGSQPLDLSILDTAHLTAYTVFLGTADAPLNTWLELQLQGKSGAAFGPELPTDPTLFDLGQSYVVNRPNTYDRPDEYFLPMVGAIDSIEITLDGEPTTPSGPAVPNPDTGTPVPEPTTLAAFASLILVMARRRARAGR